MADSSRLLNTGWYCWWNVSRMAMVTPKGQRAQRRHNRTLPPGELQARLAGAYIDLYSSRHSAELDPSAFDSEIQTVAGEVQAGDLDALPQRRFDRGDPQPSTRRIRLQPEQRADHREGGGGAPVLRPAAGLIFLGRLSGRPLGAGEQLRQPAIRVLHPRLERGARHELRRGGEP